MHEISLAEAWGKRIQFVEENVPVSKGFSAADHKNPVCKSSMHGSNKEKKAKMAKYIHN